MELFNSTKDRNEHLQVDVGVPLAQAHSETKHSITGQKILQIICQLAAAAYVQEVSDGAALQALTIL